MDAAQLIIEGKGYLGIEFGSTRIKAVLVDKSGNVLASGGHSWENRYEDHDRRFKESEGNLHVGGLYL